jgi:hypothetical protein
MTPERIERKVGDLRSKLATFSRLASSLRNATVRNPAQIDGVEKEVDLIRQALGYRTCAASSIEFPQEAA